MKLIRLGLTITIVSLLVVGCNATQECEKTEICLENNLVGHAYLYSFNGDYSGIDTIWPNESRCFTIDNVEFNKRTEEVVDKGSGILIYEYSDPNQETNRRLYPSSCETKIDLSDFNLVNYQEWCTNGFMDIDRGEIDIDCGGFCGPCGPVNPDCGISNNTITAQGGYFINGSVGQVYYSNYEHSEFFFADPFFMTFSLNNQYFDGSRRLYYTGWSEGEISVYADLGSSTYYPISPSKIHVEKLSASQLKVSFCQMMFDVNGTLTEVNGSFTFSM